MLDLVVDKRLRRGLTTVVDSTALESERRHAYLSAAAHHRVPVYAVLFEPDEALCRPATVSAPFPCPRRCWLHSCAPPPRWSRPSATRASLRCSRHRTSLSFLQPSSPHPNPPAGRRSSPCRWSSACRSRASRGPAARRRSRPVWHRSRPRRGGRLHEHLGDGSFPADPGRRPGVGGDARQLHDARLPRRESRRARLGVLVTGITYRNLAHLGKLVATLDVLSGGRAMCGLARRGSLASTSCTAGSFHRLGGATRCSRTRSNCCR